MKSIISQIESLSNDTAKVRLYKNDDPLVIFKNAGKVPGGLDKEYMLFLTETNGASIFDYCFLGFKNKNLGLNLYENVMDFWQADNSLAVKFWAFAGTSFGEAFGYLDLKNKKGSHFIGRYDINQPGKVIIIASSFTLFMIDFINRIKPLADASDECLWINESSWKNSNIDDIELQELLKINNSNEYNLKSS